MSYCKRMKRPCVCGRLSIYDRSGKLVEPSDSTSCLTNDEVSSALTILLQEWQVRFGSGKVAIPASFPAPLQ